MNNWFMKRLQDDILKGVKAGLVSWEDARLAELLKHALHMEAQLEEAKEAEAR